MLGKGILTFHSLSPNLHFIWRAILVATLRRPMSFLRSMEVTTCEGIGKFTQKNLFTVEYRSGLFLVLNDNHHKFDIILLGNCVKGFQVVWDPVRGHGEQSLGCDN